MSRSEDIVDAILFVFCVIGMIAAVLGYAMIFGNTVYHRDGFCGKVYRWMTVTIPQAILKLGNEQIQDGAKLQEFSFLNTKLRYLVIVFFAIIYAFFIGINRFYVAPYISYIVEKPAVDKFLTWALLPWPWVLLIALQYLDPGVITAENVNSYLAKYPYDNVLYGPRTHPANNLPAVPRARWCKYSNRMIARYDHYCPWVLAPIGEKTLRWFLLFLVSCIIVAGFYDYENIRVMIYMASRRGQTFWSRFMYILESETIVFSASIALTVIVIALIVFVVLQSLHISKNITTIENEIYMSRRSKKHDDPVTNFYDKGLVANWKEVLFVNKC